MKNIIIAAFAAVVLGAAIASCGNNGNVATSTATPTPIPLPSTPCTPPPNVQVQVVYPQPLSTGISTGTIVIAVAPSPLPTNYKLYVTVEDTATQTSLGTAFGQQLQVISSSQVPQPQLIPPFVAPIYESSYFGGLFGANDTFSVYLANTNCYPGTSLNSSFKT
jgi:hypothetical protein